MGLLAKIRKLLTGEPEDPVEKAEWMAEKARAREERRLGPDPAGDFLRRKPPE